MKKMILSLSLVLFGILPIANAADQSPVADTHWFCGCDPKWESSASYYSCGDTLEKAQALCHEIRGCGEVSMTKLLEYKKQLGTYLVGCNEIFP